MSHFPVIVSTFVYWAAIELFSCFLSFSGGVWESWPVLSVTWWVHDEMWKGLLREGVGAILGLGAGLPFGHRVMVRGHRVVCVKLVLGLIAKEMTWLLFVALEVRPLLFWVQEDWMSFCVLQDGLRSPVLSHQIGHLPTTRWTVCPPQCEMPSASCPWWLWAPWVGWSRGDLESSPGCLEREAPVMPPGVIQVTKLHTPPTPPAFHLAMLIPSLKCEKRNQGPP